MRVMITGGAGYVGSALVHRLASRYEVERIVVYDNLSRGRGLFTTPLPAGSRTQLRLVQGDLLDSRTLGDAVADADVVVHLAARVTTSFAHDDLHGFDQVNRWGTGELGLAVQKAPDVQRVVYGSSTAVYGDTGSVLVSAAAGATPAPVTAYGHAKAQGEGLLRELVADRSLQILRLGNTHGHAPAVRYEGLINRLAFDAWLTGRVTVEGSGEQRRSLVHVDSAARTLEAAVLGHIPPAVYDVVDASPRVVDVLQALRQLVPGLDIMFIGQHLTPWSSAVEVDPRLPTELHEPRNLTDQLRAFVQRLSMGGPADA